MSGVEVLSFYAAKGGVGCSVVAAATAVLSSLRSPTLLVDLDGELPALLGLPDVGSAGHEASGITEWLSAEDPLPDSLRRIEQQVTDRLSLLSLGHDPFLPRADQIQLLARLLAAEGRPVVIDVGLRAGVARPILDASDLTALVTRACYLGLRAARAVPEPDEVVLVAEPGRALSTKDVQLAIGRPVRTVLRWDPSVARSVDAGLLVARLPRPLRSLVAFTHSDPPSSGRRTPESPAVGSRSHASQRPADGRRSIRPIR